MTTSARSVPEATKSGNAKRTVGVMNRFTAIAHLRDCNILYKQEVKATPHNFGMLLQSLVYLKK